MLVKFPVSMLIGEQLLLMLCGVIWVSVFVHVWEEVLGLRERVACESSWLLSHHKTLSAGHIEK